jgi:hypothetical protein
LIIIINMPMLVNNHENVVEKMNRPEWVVNGEGRHAGRQSGNIQGTFREHSGTVREYSQEDNPASSMRRTTPDIA